jgi:succinoglycan biosynthesis protein ExoA
MNPPLITIIVPVRNEAKCIERTLTKLATQDYPNFEILVADGRSTDDTVAIVQSVAKRFPNIRLLDNARRLSSAARNLGVRHGRGDYLIVIDGHCDINDPQYLRKMAAAFEQSGADCLGRPQPLEIATPSAIQEAIALARRSWLGHNPSSHIYSSHGDFVKASSVAVAYRRQVFAQVGEFDERFDACEDVEFNHRVDEAGLKCWFAPEIAVHYHPRSTIPGLMRQMARYGRGRLRLAAKHPRSLTAPAIAPLAFFLMMALCAALSAVSIWFTVALAAGLGAYFAMILLVTLTLLPKPGSTRAKFCLPLVFVAIHLGFAWGTLRETVRQVFLRRIARRAFRKSECGDSSPLSDFWKTSAIQKSESGDESPHSDIQNSPRYECA